MLRSYSHYLSPPWGSSTVIRQWQRMLPHCFPSSQPFRPYPTHFPHPHDEPRY